MSCELRNLRLRAAIASTMALAGAVAAAQAAPAATQSPARNGELSIAVTGGASWSDNVGRTPSDEESGTIGRAGVELGYQHQSRRIDTSVDLNAGYDYYFDDIFDNDVVGGVDATLNLGIVPERFLWFFQENFGQITSDPFAASTPDNRENVNYFTTGPDLLFNFGSATTARLSGRYSDAQYEVADTDGQQYGGALSLARRLSGTATLSLNVEGTRFEFDDQALNTDYDRYLGYLRYEVQGARTGLAVDAGYTTLDIDGETSGGLLGRVTLSRRISPASTLDFSIGQQFSDAGDLFRDGQNTGGVSLDSASIVGTGDPFESRTASIGYNFNRNRTGFGFDASYGKETYETSSEFDRTLTTYGAYYTRQLSRAVDIRIFAQLEHEKFETTDFDDDELHAGAYLNWALGRTLALRLQYERFDRDSFDAGTDYTENQASLFLIWSPLNRS
ncbi:outer membrane beta-barrel protein [Povalibacter sp.]|uniref:outer membrane beta-barrel protein n=1 Tax=Povalibacter sp. TaxID=1962978 RepID=UPI002F3FBFE3